MGDDRLMDKFILASQSPRRKELLERIGLEFDILVSDADEDNIDKSLSPELYVQELAILKANAAALSLRNRKEKSGIVISADTVVTSEGKILGKPRNEDEAKEMLSMLSGRVHEVYTGVCVMRISDGFLASNAEKTLVYFKELSEDMIDNYIKTGECMDKAGAYGIQGMGALLVKKIDGDYFNVVGLPVSLLSDMLRENMDINIL